MKIIVNEIPSMHYKDIVVNIKRTKRGNYVVRSGNNVVVADDYSDKTLEKLYNIVKGEQ